MNKYVEEYYASGKRFQHVIALHLSPHETLESAQQKASDLPKGWFELSRLIPDDRIEFVRSFWRVTLPFAPHFNDFLDLFFDGLEDIGIFLVQENSTGPFVSEMVYSLKNDRGFFRGGSPALEEQIEALEGGFDFCQLPEDYLVFLGIHNGFCKANDTGLIPTDAMLLMYHELQSLLAEQIPLQFADGEGINPHHLIPFYQSFGLSSFQCFYADWYPEQEMGNLYYSGEEHTLSDPRQKGRAGEKLAFPTFLEWLLFYLETVD